MAMSVFEANLYTFRSKKLSKYGEHGAIAYILSLLDNKKDDLFVAPALLKSQDPKFVNNQDKIKNKINKFYMLFLNKNCS